MGGLFVDWTSGGRVGNAWGVLVAATQDVTIGGAAMAREAQILWRVFLEPVAAYLVLWVSGMWVFLALLLEALKSVLWEGSVRQ